MKGTPLLRSSFHFTTLVDTSLLPIYNFTQLHFTYTQLHFTFTKLDFTFNQLHFTDGWWWNFNKLYSLRNSYFGERDDWSKGWNRCGIPGGTKSYFLSPNCPDGLWDPPSPLLNRHQGLFPELKLSCCVIDTLIFSCGFLLAFLHVLYISHKLNLLMLSSRLC